MPNTNQPKSDKRRAAPSDEMPTGRELAGYQERVYEIVRRIPAGRVTYGQLAGFSGEGYTARTVGFVMHGDGRHGPWHRVINSQGLLDGPRRPARRQAAAMLEARRRVQRERPAATSRATAGRPKIRGRHAGATATPADTLFAD